MESQGNIKSKGELKTNSSGTVGEEVIYRAVFNNRGASLD